MRFEDLNIGMSNSSMSISFCIILFYFILCKCVIMYIYIYIHTIPDNLTTKGTISKSICRTSQHFQLTGFVNKMCHVHLCRLMRVEPGSPPKVVWELIVRNRDHNETYGYMYIYIYELVRALTTKTMSHSNRIYYTGFF